MAFKKGTKRASVSPAVAPPAKKQATNVSKEVKSVISALEASDFAAQAVAVLADVAPLSLNTPADERHPMQEKAVEMVGTALASIESGKSGQVDAKRAEVAAMDRTSKRVALVEKAQVRANAKGALAHKQAELLEAELDHNSKLEIYEAHLKIDVGEDSEYYREEEAKTKCEKVSEMVKGVASMKVGDFAGLAGELRLLGAEELLINTVQNMLAKAPEDRDGTFGKATVDTLTDFVNNRLAECTLKFGNLEGGRNERAAKSEVYKTAQDASNERFEAAKEATEEAKANLEAAEKEYNQATEEVKYFEKHLTSMQKELAALEAELVAFRDGPLATFNELKDKRKPTSDE